MVFQDPVVQFLHFPLIDGLVLSLEAFCNNFTPLLLPFLLVAETTFVELAKIFSNLTSKYTQSCPGVNDITYRCQFCHQWSTK